MHRQLGIHQICPTDPSLFNRGELSRNKLIQKQRGFEFIIPSVPSQKKIINHNVNPNICK